jgi:hypothetical protein
MIRHVLTASALVCLSFACPSTAEASWLGWFGYDRPVVYRPITTAQTFYFQPSAAEVTPVRSAHQVRICRPDRTGHPHACR